VAKNARPLYISDHPANPLYMTIWQIGPGSHNQNNQQIILY